MAVVIASLGAGLLVLAIVVGGLLLLGVAVLLLALFVGLPVALVIGAGLLIIGLIAVVGLWLIRGARRLLRKL